MVCFLDVKIMIKKIFKFLAKFVFLCFFIVLSFTKSTDADLNDRGVVFDNRFSAGTLDIEEYNPLSNDSISSLFDVKGAISTGYDVRAMKLKNTGMTDLIYEIKVSGNLENDLCKSLSLRVFKNWEQVYTGNFEGLGFQSKLSSSEVNDFMFVIQFNGEVEKIKSDKCEFNFVYNSWPGDLSSQNGLSDEEVISNTFSITALNP